MTDEELSRIESRASASSLCMHCAGSGSLWNDEGETQCQFCGGRGRVFKDPEVVALVDAIRRCRAQTEQLNISLRKALGTANDQ